MMVSITAKPKACRAENAQHYVNVDGYEHVDFRITRDISGLDRHPKENPGQARPMAPKKARKEAVIC